MRWGLPVQRLHARGRPSYHPSTMLKIYLYGYLNRVQSSRRLERQTQRNIEVMWLTGRLAPDLKTIANRTQLAPMSRQAKDAIGADEITVLADRGYYNAEQVLECDATGILPCVPKTDTSGKAQRGLFTKADYVYDADKDHYTCPAGAQLTRTSTRSDRRGEEYKYRNLTACHTCELRPRCTPEKAKRMRRWANEAVLEALQKRLDLLPEAMAIRRRTVEHVFGTLKSWMGSTHFLTRTLKNVRTEMSLSVLAYNMKRMIMMMGVPALLEAIRTENNIIASSFLTTENRLPQPNRAFLHSLGRNMTVDPRAFGHQHGETALRSCW